MITIDGTTYNIGITSLKRKAEFLDRYAERLESGDLIRELIGVYFNYDLTLDPTSADVAEYALLWQKLTEPVEFHDVTVWDETGEYTFTAYFASVGDELRRRSALGYMRWISSRTQRQLPRIRNS